MSVATRCPRQHLLQTATAEQLNVLYEIIWNTLKGNLSLTEKDYNKLYKHKKRPAETRIQRNRPVH